ncbi:MAG: hypothetical protein IT379_31315 [Deltaproteobacteria bacterium]|nr:hypothetical protein [Deltaproteobacteria bacterium]
MRRLVIALALPAGLAVGCSGGQDGAVNPIVEAEVLPEVRPNLPEVPTLPPPPHPTQYPDQSYSIYGLRKRMQRTVDTEVPVTGYIVDIYRPPECPEGRTCPPARMPHIWIADTRGEQDANKRMRVAGYAENQQMIDQAIEDARRGETPTVHEGGPPPIPTDFAVGAKVRITGQFVRVSGTGFADSQGMLDYRSHTVLEPGEAPAAPPTRGRR